MYLNITSIAAGCSIGTCIAMTYDADTSLGKIQIKHDQKSQKARKVNATFTTDDFNIDSSSSHDDSSSSHDADEHLHRSCFKGNASLRPEINFEFVIVFIYIFILMLIIFYIFVSSPLQRFFRLYIPYMCAENFILAWQKESCSAFNLAELLYLHLQYIRIIPDTKLGWIQFLKLLI